MTLRTNQIHANSKKLYTWVRLVSDSHFFLLSVGAYKRNMSQQEVQLSEVNNHLNEADLASAYTSTASMADFAQQTLLDVNSQPLIQNIMDMNHHLSESITPTELVPTSNVLDPNSPIISEFYEKFPTGRMFQSLEALRSETYEYGRKHNVALTTSKSDKTKIYLICKHGGQYRKNTKKSTSNRVVKPRVRRSQKTGCACMIYARCCRGSFWIIRKSVGEHNHPIADDPRTYAMYRSLSPENLLVVHRLLREHVGVSFIVKSLKANGVTNILAKDIENIQQDLKRRDVLELPSAQNLITDGTAESLSAALITTTETQYDQEDQDTKANIIHDLTS